MWVLCVFVCLRACGSYLLPAETWSLRLPDWWLPSAGFLNPDLTPGRPARKAKGRKGFGHYVGYEVFLACILNFITLWLQPCWFLGFSPVITQIGPNLLQYDEEHLESWQEVSPQLSYEAFNRVNNTIFISCSTVLNKILDFVSCLLGKHLKHQTLDTKKRVFCSNGWFEQCSQNGWKQRRRALHPMNPSVFYSLFSVGRLCLWCTSLSV